MKEFNLELAKAGHPVQTRSGRKARIICWDVKRDIYPIIALVTDNTGEESDLSYTLKGQFNADYVDEELDLVMAPTKHEGWVNLYRDDVTKETVLCSVCFHSQESADSHIGWSGHTYLATIKIEWEE